MRSARMAVAPRRSSALPSITVSRSGRPVIRSPNTKVGPSSPGALGASSASTDVPLSLIGACSSGCLAAMAQQHPLRADSVRLASADASFRRYFRVDAAAGSYIIMDAPPAQEDCRPFVKVAGLMAEAGLSAPHVLAWDQAQGFML